MCQFGRQSVSACNSAKHLSMNTSKEHLATLSCRSRSLTLVISLPLLFVFTFDKSRQNFAFSRGELLRFLCGLRLCSGLEQLECQLQQQRRGALITFDRVVHKCGEYRSLFADFPSFAVDCYCNGST